MKAININDRDSPFTDYILSGLKTIETREKTSKGIVIRNI